MSIRIGTFGWHYPHWVDRFYPAELGSQDWLQYYARHFQCVEINNTFYRLPTLDSIQNWLAQTPKDLRFTLKAWDREGHDVLVFFDNGRDACAVGNALALQQLVNA